MQENKKMMHVFILFRKIADKTESWLVQNAKKCLKKCRKVLFAKSLSGPNFRQIQISSGKTKLFE